MPRKYLITIFLWYFYHTVCGIFTTLMQIVIIGQLPSPHREKVLKIVRNFCTLISLCNCWKNFSGYEVFPYTTYNFCNGLRLCCILAPTLVRVMTVTSHLRQQSRLSLRVETLWTLCLQSTTMGIVMQMILISKS